MTHDELLILVTGGTNYKIVDEHLLYRKALRAVVELHKPKTDGYCEACSVSVVCLPYPCPTIQVIEKELK